MMNIGYSIGKTENRMELFSIHIFKSLAAESSKAEPNLMDVHQGSHTISIMPHYSQSSLPPWGLMQMSMESLKAVSGISVDLEAVPL